MSIGVITLVNNAKLVINEEHPRILAPIWDLYGNLSYYKRIQVLVIWKYILLFGSTIINFVFCNIISFIKAKNHNT